MIKYYESMILIKLIDQNHDRLEETEYRSTPS